MKRATRTVRKPKKSNSMEPPARKRFRKAELENLDPSDRASVERFVTEHGKILPARILGVGAKQQRRIKNLVRRARAQGVL